MLVNVFPGVSWRDREMYPCIFETDGLTVHDSNDQRLSLGADPGMDPGFPSHLAWRRRKRTNCREPTNFYQIP